MKRVVVLVLGGVVLTAALPSATIPEQVRVETGLVAGTVGTTQSRVRVFKGIPYAAPPLGDNRWRAPGPAAAWDGVRKADAFGAPCTAGGPAGGRGGRGAAAGQPPAAAAPAPPAREPARSEDCLYANVWTSARNAGDKRPVMVWIYGGGFSGGSGGLAWYDGENLAAKGPVIVTFNYRLGSLGFLAHPDLAKESGHAGSGNYGMMDAIAMLQWVKRNIAAFGGDPNKVTIAGESAGAAMVAALVGSPVAKGLFIRAIAQSGGWMGVRMDRMQSTAEAQAKGVKLMQTLGVSTLAGLRARPVTDLALPGGANLAIDGYLIPEDLSYTFQAGRQHAVDVLAGSNADEANFGLCPGAGLSARGGGPPMTVAAFKEAAVRRYGDHAETFLTLYPAGTDEDARQLAHQACGEEINWNMRQFAAAQAVRGRRAWAYYFTRVQTVNGQPSPQGATHTADISFAWNNPKGQPTQTWNDVDTKLADQMSSYWVNFITKGDPNGAGLPRWPAYKDLATSRVMVLGDTPVAEPAPPAPKLAFYSAAFQRLLKTTGTN
jgi:para-nitrobenzyl esterase